jgi:hypothetical protein
MKPGGAKDKGTGFELQVAKKIAKELGIDQQRYLPRAPESGARVQWKGDIVATDKLASVWPFLIECKKQEGWSFEALLKNGRSNIIAEWYIKACEQAKESYDKTPLLIFSRNYQPWWIAFPLQLFVAAHLQPEFYIHFAMQIDEKTRHVGVVCTYEEFEQKFLVPKYKPIVDELGISNGST